MNINRINNTMQKLILENILTEQDPEKRIAYFINKAVEFLETGEPDRIKMVFFEAKKLAEEFKLPPTEILDKVGKKFMDRNGVLFQKFDLDFNEVGKDLKSMLTHIFSIDTLTISDGINELPSMVGNMKKLRAIKLFLNNIPRLPDSIGNLTNLESLYIPKNNLVELPESIGNLKSLEKLYLFDNKLTSLPESIGNLTNLETLQVNGNPLKELPESIAKLPNLWNLKTDKQQKGVSDISRVVAAYEKNRKGV